jgi:hypothetical protein
VAERREGRVGSGRSRSRIEAEASASVETSAGDPVASPTASPGALLMADQAGSGKTLAYLLPLLQRLQAVERTAGPRGAEPASAFGFVSDVGACRSGAWRGSSARAGRPAVPLAGDDRRETRARRRPGR